MECITETQGQILMSLFTATLAMSIVNFLLFNCRSGDATRECASEEEDDDSYTQIPVFDDDDDLLEKHLSRDSHLTDDENSDVSNTSDDENSDVSNTSNNDGSFDIDDIVKSMRHVNATTKTLQSLTKENGDIEKLASLVTYMSSILGDAINDNEMLAQFCGPNVTGLLNEIPEFVTQIVDMDEEDVREILSGAGDNSSTSNDADVLVETLDSLK